jgi:hypothetical protein
MVIGEGHWKWSLKMVNKDSNEDSIHEDGELSWSVVGVLPGQVPT